MSTPSIQQQQQHQQQYSQSSNFPYAYPPNFTSDQDFVYRQKRAKLVKRNQSLPKLRFHQRKYSGKNFQQRSSSTAMRSPSNVKIRPGHKVKCNQLTKQVLEKSEAKQKIAQLEAVLKEICQNGFDEAYFCNQENHASKLVDEFTSNLISAVQKLVDRFKTRYTKARRSKFYHTTASLSTNPSE